MNINKMNLNFSTKPTRNPALAELPVCIDWCQPGILMPNLFNNFHSGPSLRPELN